MTPENEKSKYNYTSYQIHIVSFISKAHHLIPSEVATAISKFWAAKTGTPSTLCFFSFGGIDLRSLLAAFTCKSDIISARKYEYGSKGDREMHVTLEHLLPVSHLEQTEISEASPEQKKRNKLNSVSQYLLSSSIIHTSANGGLPWNAHTPNQVDKLQPLRLEYLVS